MAKKVTDLRDLLTQEEPFGPNSTEFIGEELFEKIFDKGNSAYASLQYRPFLIVGRRGSGKSAILTAIKNGNRFLHTVEVPSDSTFQDIIDKIDSGVANTTISETVKFVWEKLIWAMIFAELLKHYSASNPKQAIILSGYMSKIGLENPSLPSKIVEFVVKLLKRNSEAGEDALEALEKILDSNSTFENTKEVAIELIASKKFKVAVLIDNIEQIDLSQTSHSLALSGLLMAIDTFKKPEVPCEVRCCIPAEIYPKLVKLAANADKSFDKKTVLHWSSMELAKIASLRYFQYVRLYAPNSINKLIVGLELDNRRGLDEFIHTFFPRKITNSMGFEEPTLRYILRHTQLLPRQVISYFNAIAQKSLLLGNENFRFSEKAIIDAVSETEAEICQGIFGSYFKIHPDAQDVCNIILPELGLTFSSGEFEKIFREKKGLLPNYGNNRKCLQMLTEIGAVGVVIAENDGYYDAEFSYNLPLNLALRHADLFCVHPAFSGAFRSRHAFSEYRPIFPKGSDVSILNET